MSDHRKDSTEAQRRAKWPNYQERDRQIQKHLADVHTLIEDAAHIVGHSLLDLDNASAEEKTDTYALHERFHELAEIIRRRMQRNYSPNDGEQWSVIVAEIRSLVRRESLLRLMSKEINIAEGIAKAARYVGQTNLPHLIDQLPTKLPGDKTEKQTREQRLDTTQSEVPIPKQWDELLNKGSITQAYAAELLRCDKRTVRRLADRHELKRSGVSRIVCDEQLRHQIRKVHGQHVLR